MPAQSRRQVLTWCGVLLGAGLAGCSGQRSTPTPTGTPTDTGGEFSWPESGIRSFGRVTIGDRTGVAEPDDNRPHSLVFWNDLEAERPIRIQITEGDAVRFDESQPFPGNEALTVELLEPGVYQVQILLEDGVGGQFTVPRTQFDCNTSVTDVRVTPRGAAQHRTISTEIGCRPRINQTRFFIDERACGSGNEASVTFDDGGISVRGRIEVPTPCNGAVLTDAQVLPAENTLRIDIGITPPLPNETCINCTGAVDYRASVVLERGGVPNVVVYHDDTEVARTSQ